MHIWLKQTKSLCRGIFDSRTETGYSIKEPLTDLIFFLPVLLNQVLVGCEVLCSFVMDTTVQYISCAFEASRYFPVENNSLFAIQHYIPSLQQT